MNKHTALYGVIAHSGGLFTVVYKPEGKNTSTLQGYSADVFNGCPPEMPIIDFRAMPDTGAWWRKVYPLDAPEHGGDLETYIAASRKAGARITRTDSLCTVSRINCGDCEHHFRPCNPTVERNY